MRLTLRTLLAYLDDTLEPAQAKTIGQKIGESEQARDLIERIQQVTRRRRITTPPTGGPGGKLDANVLGEYLENVGSPEQAAEVEELCLTSDPHLAEVAACHQVLSLILGEPALVPPSAKQRMYGLVKGPEAIPFRKPPKETSKGDLEPPEGRDVDDTLRLGLPAVSSRTHGNPMWVIGGAVVAAGLLLFAVWQILKPPSVLQPEPDANNPLIAQVAPGKDKAPPVNSQQDKPEEKNAVDTEPKEEKKQDAKEKVDAKPPMPADVPVAPPSAVIQKAGTLLNDAKNPTILAGYFSDKMEWRRIDPKSPEVSTGRPLVSMPAAQSTIQLDNGLKLTLVGNMPELVPPEPWLYESTVELHAHDRLDLDLTIRRGRIRVSTPDRPARIRVRFENTSHPDQSESFDLVLQSAGTEVLFDRWSMFPAGEKFFKNPKATDRIGPISQMACVVLSGAVKLRFNDVAVNLKAAPGDVLITWNSLKGLDKAVTLEALPPGLKSIPPLPPEVDARPRTELLKARDALHQRLQTAALDVGLAATLKLPEGPSRRLACWSLGAIDDISTLFELLEQEPADDLRYFAGDVLRHWISAERDCEYRLFDVLKMKYRAIDAENILTLLHGYGEKDLNNPDTYGLLINYLTHSALPIRELSAWHLYMIVPAGQKIRYRAADEAPALKQAQAAWRALIPAGQMPPKK